jgi:mannitol operon transcriptional antiterminator
LAGAKDALKSLEDDLRELVGSQAPMLEMDVRRERLTLLMSAILVPNDEPQKLIRFSDALDVSEATISKDMDILMPWFERFELTLERRPGFGVRIKGNESGYRQALVRILLQVLQVNSLPETDVKERIRRSIPINWSKAPYNRVLDLSVLEAVEKCLELVQPDLLQNLTITAQHGFKLYCTVMVMRVRAGAVMDCDPEIINDPGVSRSRDHVARFASMLEHALQLKLPNSEICGIRLQLSASRIKEVSSTSPLAVNGEYDLYILDIIRRLTHLYDPDLAPFFLLNEEFVSALMNHLRSALVRLMNHLPIENPMLDAIQTIYPEIYEKTARAAHALEEQIGHEIPETEIGYLAIHFGAAWMNLRANQATPRTVVIGLICGSGIGISRLMASALRRRFGRRIRLYTFGELDLGDEDTANIDFFVTATRHSVPGVNTIRVNQLLPEEDLRRLDRVIKQYAEEPPQTIGSPDSLGQLESLMHLSKSVNGMVNDFAVVTLPAELSLDDLFRRIADRFAEPDQQKSLYKSLLRREKMGSMIIKELSLGLIHTRTTAVDRTCLAVLRPEEGSCFTDPTCKEAAAVLVMLVPEDPHVKANLAAVGYISEMILEDPNFLPLLHHGEEAELQVAIAKYLKTFLTNYIK